MGLKFPDARETAQPEAGAEMEAAAKVAGNTAAPAKPAAAQPVATKLTDKQIKEAQAWYAARKDQYTPEVLKQIQQKLGIAATGKADVATVQAIAKWQRENKDWPCKAGDEKFSVDGKASAKLLEKMFPSGLNDWLQMVDFSAKARKAINSWKNLSLDQRKAQVIILINQTLAGIGVPPIKTVILIDGKAENAYGLFLASEWTISIDRDLIENCTKDSDKASRLADTLYHEMRHADQNFALSRLAANQDTKYPNPVDTLSSVAKIAAQRPLKTGSIEGIKANRFYQYKYGPESESRLKTRIQFRALENKEKSISGAIKANEENLAELLVKFNKTSGQEKVDIGKAIKSVRSLIESQKKESANVRLELSQLTRKIDQMYDESPLEDDAWRIGGMVGYLYGHP